MAADNEPANAPTRADQGRVYQLPWIGLSRRHSILHFWMIATAMTAPVVCTDGKQLGHLTMGKLGFPNSRSMGLGAGGAVTAVATWAAGSQARRSKWLLVSALAGKPWEWPAFNAGSWLPLTVVRVAEGFGCWHVHVCDGGAARKLFRNDRHP